MSVEELIAAIKALPNDPQWAEQLSREIAALDAAFESQSARLEMKAADFEFTYSI